MIDEKIAYQALKSHDPRFDGMFFVGVSSTGIYCRPICPAKTPLYKNCNFFATAAAAEKAMFRPCLRCRPELAPGNAPVDKAQQIAYLMLQRLDENVTTDEEGISMEQIAAEFAMSSRQLRRIVQQEYGVSPIELLQTRRLLLAKQLLTESDLPVIDIAFASGFSSLRRFNDAFRHHYRMPPTRLRKEASTAKVAASSAGKSSRLQLTYRPPYDWHAMLDFLRSRVIQGVEWVTDDAYLRTVAIGSHQGWIKVSHVADRQALTVEFAHELAPVLPALLGRLRHLFDLTARPDLIADHLGGDRRLKKSLMRHPGLRVPGAFDLFEMILRAILGQQITVKAATTLAGRFATSHGKPIETPYAELNRLTPQAEAVARFTVNDIASLGIVSARASCIIMLAHAIKSGALRLEAGALADEVIQQLVALPGIGPWTANYIAMRALRWPDAFPKEDIVVRKSLGGVSARAAEEISQRWRPWRSYAVMHLWKSSAEQ